MAHGFQNAGYGKDENQSMGSHWNVIGGLDSQQGEFGSLAVDNVAR
jgi:hypothetical protein